jgi:hypothetical protein
MVSRPLVSHTSQDAAATQAQQVPEQLVDPRQKKLEDCLGATPKAEMEQSAEQKRVSGNVSGDRSCEKPCSLRKPFWANMMRLPTRSSSNSEGPSKTLDDLLNPARSAEAQSNQTHDPRQEVSTVDANKNAPAQLSNKPATELPKPTPIGNPQGNNRHKQDHDQAVPMIGNQTARQNTTYLYPSRARRRCCPNQHKPKTFNETRVALKVHSLP